MTHDHDHSNDHSHSHSHGSDHNHVHHHEHSHETHKHELSFEQKLEKLFSHWIEHNNSHKETFMTWAERARQANLTAVAEDIEKAADASEKLTVILQEAQTKLRV